jgi:uncharacterized membrane protein YeiH
MTAAAGAIAAVGIHYGGWKWTGNFTGIDLIAAATNALNGALLARRPDHYKNFTVVGILLMALLGGLGGGITRDVLLNKVPVAFMNPALITVCLVAGVIGYGLAFKEGQLFREGLFQLATSFSLPWYAIVGAQAAAAARLPVIGILAVALIATTAGRYFIDVSCGVPPKQFVSGELFVVTAVVTAAVWVACNAGGLGPWPSAGISFAVGFTLRVTALYKGWQVPLAKEPAGVYQHSDGRPLLGRKIAGKSVREMKDLGLTVEPTGTEKG